MQQGFHFDQSRCIGCFSCVAACRSAHFLSPDEADIISIEVYEECEYPDVSLVPTFTTCFHCEQPACVEACVEGIFSKRPEDGIVLLENIENCSGCGLCVESCPYKAPKIVLSELGGEYSRFLKCDLCIDQLQQKKAPLCMRACPVEAITVGSIYEFKEQGFARDGKKYPDYHQTLPCIFFGPQPT